MTDADLYSSYDMAHEFCDPDEFCNKWHCPFFDENL